MWLLLFVYLISRAGGGTQLSVILDSDNSLSQPVKLVSYAAPKITAISAGLCVFFAALRLAFCLLPLLSFDKHIMCTVTCAASNQAGPPSLTQCPRQGGGVLSVTGSNFGPRFFFFLQIFVCFVFLLGFVFVDRVYTHSGAEVLIGGVPCINTTHSAITPHSSLTYAHVHNTV